MRNEKTGGMPEEAKAAPSTAADAAPATGADIGSASEPDAGVSTDPISGQSPEDLIHAAQAAMKAAYAPYSRFRVGAALVDEAGRVHTGCNVENASYGATICAERTAAVKAVSAGARRIMAVAVVSDAVRDTMPCGICRQFLAEFTKPDTPFYCGNRQGVWHAYRMSDFLPHAFDAADMNDEAAPEQPGQA